MESEIRIELKNKPEEKNCYEKILFIVFVSWLSGIFN